VSLCLFLIVGIYTRRVPNRRLYCMAASVVTPFIGLLALSMIPNSPATKWTKWGLYLITVPYVLALFLAWSLIPSNVAGRTKKTIISSCTFLGYCVGNMAGSQIFKKEDEPRYGKPTSRPELNKVTATRTFWADNEFLPLSHSPWNYRSRRVIWHSVRPDRLLETVLRVAESPSG